MVDFAMAICSRANFSFLKVIYLIILVNTLNAVMIKKECPVDETHRSCWFYEEYSCWEDEQRLNRMITLPHRLSHCIAGCYCKSGYVRGYPNGPCIQAPLCMNGRIRNFLNKLPA